MTGRVQGKVAFISGAARGQGRSHAIRLAEEGADIIAVDVCESIPGVPYPLATEDEFAQTVSLVEKAGGRIVAVKADVRHTDQLASAVEQGVREFGRLDIVIANAGITGPYSAAPSVAERVQLFEQVVNINLSGVYRTVEVCKQHLIDSAPGGVVILTSSLAGLRALGAGGGYTEAKHGLVGMMRSYAHELAPHMIRVNSIHPSNVNTPMIVNEATRKAFRPDLENPTDQDVEAALMWLNLMPVPFVEANDISNAVLFLASDEARYITGVALPVDAGAAIK
jgi:SDR family mycofactocin-dependent oxidoreductase